MRARTYLSPGLPLGLFQLVADELANALGLGATLDADEQHSGPPTGAVDPFSAGEVDLAFMCAPSYLRLAALDPSPVLLVPAGFVFDDDRNDGLPVYFTDVVVPRDRAAAMDVSGLAAGRWAYNDAGSLSGYACIAHELPAGAAPQLCATGSHEASVRAVLSGTADVAAVDANVLRRLARQRPSLQDELRVVLTWGPYPVQPILASRELGRTNVDTLAKTLLSFDDRPAVADALRRFGVRGFAPTDHDTIAHQLAWLR